MYTGEAPMSSSEQLLNSNKTDKEKQGDIPNLNQLVEQVDLNNYKNETGSKKLGHGEIEFQYQGFTVELTMTCQYAEIGESVRFNFSLSHNGREFVVADIMIPDEQYTGFTYNGTPRMIELQVQRVGPKNAIPTGFSGIGLNLTEKILDCLPTIAAKLEIDLLDRIVPTIEISADEWRLINNEQWEKKFLPLLKKHGYVEKQIDVEPNAKNIKTQTVYEKIYRANSDGTI